MSGKPHNQGMTSLYSLQGHGLAGLDCLARVGEEMNMPVITELMDGDDLGAVLEYSDIIQIGARNMYNYSLLHKWGRINKPVVLT